MDEILAELTRYKVSTPLLLTGTIIVARDIAHAKIKERLDSGEPMLNTLKIILCITQALPKRLKECLPDRLARPLPAGWIAMSMNFRPLAAR